MTDTRTVHDGFNKEVWLTEYDKASYEHAWFQLMKEGTPEDITPEQAIRAVHDDERVLDNLFPTTEGRALELGADWGRFALYKVFTTALTYEACNTSTVMNAHLEGIAERLNITDRLNCSVMFAEDIQFPNGTFDVVYIFETLEHVGELDKAISEMKRVLKLDGQILFSLPLLSYADGGFHTQQHGKEFWLSKFAEHGLTADVEVEHNPAGADLPNGETGLVGRLINTGYGRPD